MFHVKHSIVNTTLSTNQVSYIERLIENNAQSLGVYSEQLLWWNKKINLVSRDVSRETIEEHIAHSLLIASVDEFKKAESIIDTGTGGGLPGIPLAICNPKKSFVLNDIVTKKIMAVKQMALKVKCGNVITNTSSISDLKISPGTVVVTKHAFKLYELWDLIGTKPWDSLIFLKGASEAADEIRNIDEPLKMTIYHLDEVLNSSFYSGKAIVVLSRNNEKL